MRLQIGPKVGYPFVLRVAKPTSHNPGETTVPTSPSTSPEPTPPVDAPGKSAQKKPRRKSSAKKTAVKKTPSKLRTSRPKTVARKVSDGPMDDEIRLRAYFIAENRSRAGLAGDPAQDWIEARRQLQDEARG